MWRLIYRALWTALSAAAGPLVRIFARGSGKFARAVAGRGAAADALVAWASVSRKGGRPLVWFHAASVGEGRQAEAVLVRLRAARPDWQIVYTHSSASAEPLAGTLPVDFAGYLPADTIADTSAALDAVAPSALVFSTTDLWPELVRQAQKRGIPLGLISATLAPTSSRRGPVARGLLGPAYAALDRVGAVDERDADALVDLGVRRGIITVTGDTRHDSAAARAAAIDRSHPALRVLLSGGPPILVAGSTWPADEAELLPAVCEVRTGANLRVVIAPHEPSPEHLADLAHSLTGLWPDVRLSRLGELEGRMDRHDGTAAWDVCLVDRVGVLADLYAAAAMAYVGGGFHDAGLHSVIEPAALGVPVLFGPRWQSSRDARLLLEAGGGVSADGRSALAAALAAWLRNDEARAAAGAAARAVVDAGIGAADRSLRLVLELVERPR